MFTANPSSPMPSSGQAAQLQLHDIHVPEQVSNLPVAPGWWLLLALIIITAVWSYKKIKQRQRLSASKNKALAILANNQAMSAKECITLLKWTAMQYFSRQQLAKIYGENFQHFLTQQLPLKHQAHFTTLITPAVQGQYQQTLSSSGEIDGHCQQATKLWLTHALPIKSASTRHNVKPVEMDSASDEAVNVGKEKELSA
ncbi:DUF4381 domain-containing protein [Colwellia piezophila]|uniref:DUF4381 domain-containing protein n=1 Tax=Colwellia piezophila TaxID=211668 RepID=UPI00036B70BD|nr:DUF4381 domain-containing protein [Colwellia piezophila]